MASAVSAIQQGAYDFIEKPLSLEKVVIVAARALEAGSLRRENQVLRTVLPEQDELIGQSPVMLKFQELLARVAPTDVWVLLTGENGTGKELAARALHAGSRRADAPMIAVNCAAIPEELIESELFGHEKGAFTSADQARAGRFEMANNGTLFLDEIGDMPLALQAKILRCIQEKAIEPVGSNTTQKVDVRIIAATNQNLVEAIEKGKFRRDLYYRLNVYPIIMPSLRERKEDIPLLAEHFALRAAGEMGKVPVTFTEAALEILKNHTWPGNIRELENCIERLTIIASGTAITPERLASCAVPGGGDASRPSAPGSAFPLDLDRQLAETERDLILRALEETGGVQVKAAELLNISERSMWHRIKKLGINIINKKEMI